jgi:glycosyltransferase involved in cell wall biosynthesis
VDTATYYPDSTVPKDGSILFVGRILPHKGINYLIEAFRHLQPSKYKLKIIGRIYDQRYYQDLCEAAQGLAIDFMHEATDIDVVRAYRQATVAVLPSVHTDVYGNYTATPELMGFTLLEAQACGTPVICTDAGAMPEFVREGITGRIVEQNAVEALAAGLRSILDLLPADYDRMSREAHAWAERFSWKQVAAAHLQLYQAG